MANNRYSCGPQPFLKYISDPLLAGRALSALAGLGTVMGIGLASFFLFKKFPPDSHNRSRSRGPTVLGFL